jgi:nitrate/nitrite-specific signal transduction histidine kinase
VTGLARRALDRLVYRFPFRGKVVGLVIVVALVLGAVSAVEARQDLHEILIETLDTRGVTVAVDLAHSIRDDLAAGGDLQVSQRFYQAMAADSGLVYAFVTGEDRTPGVSTLADGVPSGLVALAPVQQSRPETTSVTAVQLGDERIRHVITPAFGAPPAVTYLHIGLSERPVEAVVNRATQRILTLSLFAATLAAAAGYALTRLLLAPLEELLRGMQDLGAGDLSRRVAQPRDADLAYIADSFNQMASGLEEAQILQAEDRHRIEVSNRELTLLHDLRHAMLSTTSACEFLAEAVHLISETLGASGVSACARIGPGASCHASTESGEGTCPQDRQEDREECLADRLVALRSEDCQSPLCVDCDRAGQGCQSLATVFAAGEEVAGHIHALVPSDADMHDSRFILESIAEQLGLMLDNVRLRDERIEREARLESLLGDTFSRLESERRRIARDLHDDIGQKLTFLKLGLKVLEDSVHSGAKPGQIVAGLRSTVADAVAGVRRAVAELGSAPLDRLGLPVAIERLLREASSNFGYKADLQVVDMDGCALTAPVELAAYRVTQEALSNAGRHSDCSRVSVVVHHKRGVLEIIVEDDGCGFEIGDVRPDSMTGRHVGIDSMRERCTLAGGELRIESAVGVGTSVHVRLPSRAVNTSEV